MVLAIETDGLTKRFGGVFAIDRVAMRVPHHAIYGFLGANGAGKTTTLRLLLGLLRRDAGTIRFFGATTRPWIGSLIETPSAYDHLTGRENLDIAGCILDLPRGEVDRVLSIVDLTDAGGRRVRGYSLGMRQRLGIARALLGNPRLLILDEPINGLDPDGIRDMRALLKSLPQVCDSTLIISSHLLSEIELIATHVGLLHCGRLLVEGPLGELLGANEGVEVGTTDQALAETTLSAAGYRIEVGEDRLLVRDEADPAKIAALLVGQGQELSYLAPRRGSLERLYHNQIALAA